MNSSQLDLVLIVHLKRAVEKVRDVHERHISNVSLHSQILVQQKEKLQKLFLAREKEPC